MESFLDLVKRRQSAHSFTNKPVEKEKIDRILEIVRLSPSACNAQPWKFIVVTDEEKRQKIADATSKRFLPVNHFSKQAPVLIVIVEESTNFFTKVGCYGVNRQFPLIDIGIATAHLCLAATNEGLDTHVIGWYNEKKIQQALEIPENKKVMLVVALGYSDEEVRPKKRKKIEELVSYNKY
ncbi:MAG: putative NAD(P)H nitroreductase [Bacteroidetes bacterium ADurb.BinA395]|jgi:nitroreductase|nr:nitroreductase family protein [Paludibacteraceae bacterium]OPZ01772.1 MAG: putative NAD(P)H nitroreductase [Bacteroidetes bacterium ADurb.BinA395]HOF98327.1 nitroreductase family protein [Paludibacteraceae bacterium]HOR38986.1 nitroreductase family protein [Paludibacteraceae bacterium]HQG67962.1 nitroreductase family protein [Paludibacteraceae bacterium]